MQKNFQKIDFKPWFSQQDNNISKIKFKKKLILSIQ